MKVYFNQNQLAEALGVTRGAIADRLRRGTLTPDAQDAAGKPLWVEKSVRLLQQKKNETGRN
ncbi:hypothetical protein EBB07_08825 [Paenibacillaceae bacterium]|nr:hypothetical protein EBB07_08825 [Paenibacillaceae bacterium]